MVCHEFQQQAKFMLLPEEPEVKLIDCTKIIDIFSCGYPLSVMD